VTCLRQGGRELTPEVGMGDADQRGRTQWPRGQVLRQTATPKGGVRRERHTRTVPLENVTIERKGRKGRKVRQDFSAAFAAFAFQGGVG